MSGSKWILGVAAVALAAAMSTPTYAGKQVITDGEMDAVTAAGQPIVIKNSDSDIDVRDETILALGIEDNAQSDLRALVLNNTLGENQVGTGLNIASGGSTGRQDNNITQSWGATYDREIVPGSAKSSTTTASKNGADATCGRDALICKPVGGNASASATASASVTPATRLSIYADQIVLGDDDVDYRPVTSIAMDVRDTAQIGLSALVVNNVSGLNQVANGVNIAGGVGTGGVGAGNVSVTSASATAGQGNITNQFRGTSYSRPDDLRPAFAH
ncbi:MAG TPA: hypothetical protein VGJ57_10920 [Nitrospirales bacterium]